jgi:hypothetical protein
MSYFIPKAFGAFLASKDWRICPNTLDRLNTQLALNQKIYYETNQKCTKNKFATNTYIFFSQLLEKKGGGGMVWQEKWRFH